MGRGKRRKSRNPQHFNTDTVNVLMSDSNQENVTMNDEEESQDAIDNYITPVSLNTFLHSIA